MSSIDEETLKDFRQKLQIDQSDLERECREQPSLYESVGDWVAEVRARARTAERRVKFVRGDLSLKIRKEPEDFGLGELKVTESVIEATVVINSECEKAEKAYEEARKLADKAQVLLEAVAQRKSSLRDLVTLFVRAYYARADDLSETERKIVSHRDRKALRQEETEDSGSEV